MTKIIYCWWCCHNINNTVLHMPYNYIKKSKKYEVYGNFCSWECMKAYNLNENDYQQNNRTSLILRMFYDTNKCIANINIAPPRQKLKVFGGDLDIKEFRNVKDEYILTLPPLININHYIEKNNTNNYKFINNDEATHKFKNTTKIKIDPIKIKNQEKNDNTSLKSVLGIIYNK